MPRICKMDRIIAYILDCIVGFIPIILIACKLASFLIFNVFNVEVVDTSSLGGIPFYIMLISANPCFMFLSLPIGITDISEYYIEISCIISVILSKFLYYTLMELILKDTIGKKILHITTRDKNGFNISFTRKIIRNIFKVISEFTVIPCFLCISDKKGLSFYDKLLSTNVYDKKDLLL